MRCNERKGDRNHGRKKNLCALIPTALHDQVCEAREAAGLTTAQYITNLLTEYYEMKKNGGNQVMANTNTRTMAFQIGEDLFLRIKAHLEREAGQTALSRRSRPQRKQVSAPVRPRRAEQPPRAWTPPTKAVRRRMEPRRTSAAAGINNSSNRAAQANPMGMAWAALAA